MSSTAARRARRIAAAMSVAGLTLTACGGSGSAGGADGTYHLQYSTFTGQDNPTQEAFEWWIEQVEERTNGAVTIEPFYSEALLSGSDTLAGLRDGRTDLATVGGSYSPENFLTQVVGIPFVTTNAEAQMRAFTDLYEQNTDFRNEWESKNAHVLMFPPNTPNIIGTKRPISTVSDLDGMQIRASGFVSDALAAVDANVIALPSPEIYEAVERGVIDGYSGFTFDFVADFQLDRVAPFITDPGTGNYVVAPIVIRKDLFDEMPAEIQDTITEVSKEYMDEVMVRLVDLESTICDEVIESGGDVSVFPVAETDKWKAAVGDSIYEKWVGTVPAGVDATAFFEQYTGLIAEHEETTDYIPGVEKCAERTQ